MKLINKETHEIGYTAILRSKAIVVMDENAIQLGSYTSLAGLCAEWKDAPEDPKKYWFIDPCGEVISMYEDEETPEATEASKAIGNYFETQEEAELAIRKLKAWKRLKDNGMIKYSFHREKRGIDLDFYTLTVLVPRDKDSLDLLFGDEE